MKALEIAARAKVACTEGVWIVPAQTSSGSYRVTLGATPPCPCDDFQSRRRPCKHIIVTAVELGDRDAADSPFFKALVEQTAANVTVKEVPADKAYVSNDNLELVHRLGGTAFVPYKVNSQAGEAGSLWEKTYFYYQFRRDEFLKHSHQRSNTESTFSMVKAKFRDHVRSKTDVAMKNEVLCKFLCHDLCVVHQSPIELGIEPEFWADRPIPRTGEAPAQRPVAQPGEKNTRGEPEADLCLPETCKAIP